jgi:NADPH:quinone reductase-like Zn-dependent oxidoreductase
MKAVRHHSYGDTSVLRYEEAPRPVPGAGQVLVRVAATTFNPVDAAIRAGYLQQVFPLRFPHIPGLDVAGTVEQTGDGVTGLGVGDPVIGFLPMGEDGAAADFVLAPADVLVAAPQSIPLPQAAALPTVGLTAWQALFEHADLTSGQRILINGAGGAVGGVRGPARASGRSLCHRHGDAALRGCGPASRCRPGRRPLRDLGHRGGRRSGGRGAQPRADAGP